MYRSQNGQVSAAKSEVSTAVALTYQETDFGDSVIVAVGGRCIDLHETNALNVMSLPPAITHLPILHGDFQVAAFGEAKRLDHETRTLIVGNNQVVHVGQHMVVRQLKHRD